METKLKKYRLNRRFTQSELAHRAGMSERAYNVHEKGRGTRCQDLKQKALADALGVRVGLLFDAEGRAR